MNDELSLFIHDAKGAVHQIKVLPLETIDSISKRIGYGTKLLHFFNGMLLIGAFTFHFYKLTNGDHIYSIPIGPKLSQEILNKFQSLKDLTEKQHEIHKRKMEMFKYETAKIKDQFFEKLEGTVACNRKLIERFKQLRKEEKDTPTQTTVIPPLSTMPSSGELPSIWQSNTN